MENMQNVVYVQNVLVSCRFNLYCCSAVNSAKEMDEERRINFVRALTMGN